MSVTDVVAEKVLECKYKLRLYEVDRKGFKTRGQETVKPIQKYYILARKIWAFLWLKNLTINHFGAIL
jgi:hypothetical protein